MVICFHATAETRDQLDGLVTSGAYRDYGEAIAAAVRNQILLEQEVAAKGSIVVGDRPAETPAPVSPAPVTPAKEVPYPAPTNNRAPKATVKAAKSARKNTLKTKPTRTTVAATAAKTAPASPKAAAPAGPLGIPATFLLDGLPEADAVPFVELPPDMWAPGRPVPLDRWVFGQQNRILPAKVNARALIRLFAETGKALPIGMTGEQIAAEAAALGDYLAVLDQRRDTGRDDAFATAFPTTGEDADKGRVRYANQFVAYANARGELSGLMVDLKLINVVTMKKERCIVPTKVAWAFAWMPNPILDPQDPDVPPTEKFSRDEREFLHKHIAKSVPAEAFAYRAILEAVGTGHNTPETLDAALKAHVTADRVENLSQSFLSSQRSGAVSRMSDLNLIGRQREGTRVTYVVTGDGLKFLDLCTSTGGK